MPDLSANTGYWLQQAANAVFLACVYSTLATAYALLQGITSRIIFTFGDIATFGAYAAVSMAVWSLVRGEAGLFVLLPAMLGAAIAAAALSGFAGAVLAPDRSGRTGQSVMIASVGLAIALQEALRLHSGSRDLWLPPLFDGRMVLPSGVFSVAIGHTQLAVALACVAALAALYLVMRLTRAGRLWRAVSENRRLAELCGVNTAAVFRWSFMAAGSLAGLAGAVVATTYGGVSFAMGLTLGFKAMFAAIIGGFGTLRGALAGGILLAAVEVAWVSVFPAAYRDAVIFGMIVMILILRPEGLLGHELKRDSAI